METTIAIYSGLRNDCDGVRQGDGVQARSIFSDKISMMTKRVGSCLVTVMICHNDHGQSYYHSSSNIATADIISTMNLLRICRCDTGTTKLLLLQFHEGTCEPSRMPCHLAQEMWGSREKILVLDYGSHSMGYGMLVQTLKIRTCLNDPPPHSSDPEYPDTFWAYPNL